MFQKGTRASTLLNRLEKWGAKEAKNWNEGQASGAVYHGGSELSNLHGDVFKIFALSNPLHPELFPYVRKMEAEIVRMCANLYHGDEVKSCGTLSSGGTESILLACKAYRDRARHLYSIETPEIIAPITVHAAFEKAAHYFGMKLIHVPVQPDTMTG